IVRSDFLINPTERALQQRQVKYDSIGALIKAAEFDSKFDDPEELALLREIKESHESSGITFSQLTSKNISEELKDRLLGQLLMKSQNMATGAFRLADRGAKEMATTQQRVYTSVVVFIIIISVLITATWLIIRGISKPVQELGQAAMEIGKGNFEYRADIKSRDELGDLGGAFNDMAVKLKELDKLKDDFLSTTTHELRTPLVPIKSQAQLLLAGDYGKLNKEQTEAIEMIHKNEENLNILTSEVLDIAKIKSNKLKLILEKVALSKIITEIVNEQKNINIAEKKHLTISLLPFPEMPQIMADQLRISQVIKNLLDNAIKFTPENGKVSVEVRNIKNDITVMVKDTGIGITSEDLGKLFTPFFQIQSNLSRKYRGTGLGLAISKGIIEAHGGRIWAESKGEGKGSTFIFSLPIKI
ncbi:MAG: HAMP domain-containing histidine kinase, partial [Candidatus Aenigmarchaeota archaeon]|nr:HAMP domain-containing histidine kinase [Candidatus Aenigmarchaeota archaeon]